MSNFYKVSPDAKIGNNVNIGDFSTIYENVEIGDNCTIYGNVTIFPGARIGEGVTIFPGAVISAVRKHLLISAMVLLCVNVSRLTGALPQRERPW